MPTARIIPASFVTANGKEEARIITLVAFQECPAVMTAASCVTILNFKVCGQTTSAATDEVAAGLPTAPLIPENSSTTSGKVTVRMSMKTAAFILASFGTTSDLDMACELQC